MKYIKYLLFIIMATSGCKKDALITYNTFPDIYFRNIEYPDNPQARSYYNSVNFSFTSSDDTTYTVPVTIEIAGKPTSENRTFALSVDEALSTAKPEIDYTGFAADSFYIPADSTYRTIKLVFNKTAALYEDSVKLVLKLSANNNFAINLQSVNDKNGVADSATIFYIKIDNFLPKPDYWDDNANYLGTYSREKLVLLAEVNDVAISDIPFYPGSSIAYFAIATQDYLDEQKAMGNIIYERDGTPMMMGPLAQ